MAIPQDGWLVVCETWRKGEDSFALFVGLRTRNGSFELWTSDDREVVINFISDVAPRREDDGFYGVYVSFEGMNRDRQTFTTENPLRRYIARCIRQRFGGNSEWHPVLNDDSTTLENLVPDRTGTGSSFRPPASPAAAAVAKGDNPTFDATSLKSRLAARRRGAKARAAGAQEMAAGSAGSRRVKAFHGDADGIVSDLPVIGATDDAAPIPGRIVSNNPAFAVIEAGESDLDRTSSPITWVLGDSYNPRGFVVGTTPAQTE